MQLKTHRTERVVSGDSLFKLIDDYLPKMNERSVFVITSKIISLCEGSVIPKEQVESKEELIQQSADAYLDLSEEPPSPHAIQITIKNSILIPSAGIDESNGEGIYILYPKDIQDSATKIWEHIRKRDQINELGVIITDSHTTPMRRGVIGIGLGWCGFNPLYSYIGKPDCFGNPLRVTMVNNLDALSVAAVFCMGEGNEQTPFCVIENVPRIEFQIAPPSVDEVKGLSIPLEEDLYAPLLKNKNWITKNSNSSAAIRIRLT